MLKMAALVSAVVCAVSAHKFSYLHRSNTYLLICVCLTLSARLIVCQSVF